MHRLAWAWFAALVFLIASTRVHAQAQQAPATPAEPLPPLPPAQEEASSARGQAELDAQRMALQHELALLDQELQRLRAARPPVALPVVLVAGGFGVALISGLITLTRWGISRERGYRWDARGNRHAYTHFARSDRVLLSVYGGIAAASLSAAVVGLVLLVPRMAVRRELTLQAQPLKERRRKLMFGSVQYSLDLDGSRVGVAASARF